MKTERAEKVLSHMRKAGLKQMIVSDPLSIFYLTGIELDPGERMLALCLKENGEHILCVNGMFSVPEVDGLTVARYSDWDTPSEVLKRYLDPAHALGVDDMLQAKFLVPLYSCFSADRIVTASSCVNAARAAKDAEEIRLLRECSRVNDETMRILRGLIKEGITEKAFAKQILDIYLSLGAQGPSFSPIVAFGKNAAAAHHVPDETPLRAGDTVLLDIGCRKEHYCSDMTRVFFYRREPSAFERTVYSTCRRATEAAEKACAPGVPLADIDAAGRRIIEEAGFGKNFRHRLGHFIGLEDHDPGDVSPVNRALTVPGNVFSVEPSISIPDTLCFYIEDLMLITESGAECLNSFPHDLDVVE